MKFYEQPFFENSVDPDNKATEYADFIRSTGIMLCKKFAYKIT